MWQQLINTALLGTDKISFDENKLPESIRTIIGQIPENDKEARFLKTAALVAFYQEAGQQPKRFEGELNIQAQTQRFPIASSKFMAILDDIVTVQTQFRNYLLELWLDSLLQKKQVCTAKKTVILLSLSEHLPKRIQLKIPQVLGKNGLDLWALKTNIAIEAKLTETQIWEEGKLLERRTLFRTLRENNPIKALELLKSTWETESLNDKMAFVEAIQHTFSVDDVAFLTEILPTFAFKDKERKTQREIRRIIMGLLMGVPQNSVYFQTTEALKMYVKEEKVKGVLGWVGKENKVLILPQEEDVFLNLNNIETMYGFEASPDFAVFTSNQNYWLSCFMAFIPFDFWVNMLERNLTETVNYFLSEAFLVKLSGKKTAILLGALIKNATHHRDVELAKALIDVTNIADQLPLLNLLSIPEREQYLISTKQLNSLPSLEACFDHWEGTWSADFSTKILRESYKTIIENNTFLNEKIALIMSQHLHPSSDKFLSNAKVYPVSATPYYINFWEKNFVNAITDSLQIKQKCREVA